MVFPRWIFILVMIITANESIALTIGQFETVTDKGVTDFWDPYKTDGVYYNNFGYANNAVWFVSARFSTSTSTWENLVARLDLSNNNNNNMSWTHKKVRGWENSKNMRIFTMAGGLFMLIADYRTDKVPAERLMTWKEDEWRSVEAPFPRNLCNGPAEYNELQIGVPDHDGNTAFIGASCWRDDTNTTLDFHKLTVNTRVQPARAELTHLATGRTDVQESLSSVFERNGTVLALSTLYTDRCFFCLRENHAYAVPPGSETVVGEATVHRPDDVEAWIKTGAYFQLDAQALFVGGRRSNPAKNSVFSSPDDYRRTIRRLDLDTLTWADTGVEFPVDHYPLLDQRGKRLFALSFRNGLKVARITP